MTYVKRMKKVIRSIRNRLLILRSASDYDGWIPERLDWYFTDDWDRWLRDTALE